MTEVLNMQPFKFRSRINQLPMDVKTAIAEVSYQKQMYASQRRACIAERLRHHGIEYTELGTGTNRFIVKFEGYALKIALDHEGVADNKQEWVIEPQLAPDVSHVYEVSKGGHLLVASYIPAFTSFQEMREYENSIRAILKKWAPRFLLGDVGLSSINYANWGVLNRQPKCIDYAYIFPASMDLFECVVCGNKQMGFTGNDFTTYKCTKCQTEFTDREIRSRISNETRMKLFADMTSAGLEMTQPVEEHVVHVPKIEKPNPSYPDPAEVADDILWHIYGRRFN